MEMQIASVFDGGKKLPLVGLVGIVLFYWFGTGLLNPVALVLMSLLVAQLIFDRRILGMIVGGIFTLLSLYMYLALISEFNGIDLASSQNFWIGFTYLSLAFILSLATLVLYSKMKTTSERTT